MKIVISSGHGEHCPGAIGYINEYDEACLVVDAVAQNLTKAGAGVATFHDTVSHTQNENLKRIVDFHNSHDRDLDVSIHFNAYQTTDSPMGTECLYVTQAVLAEEVATNISLSSGLKNRGAKKRTDLYFLNKTTEPAILIEVCFVDSKADVALYHAYFDQIAAAIASTLMGSEGPQPPPPPSGGSFHATGKASTFGGPNDTGVAPNEGLAFISSVQDAPQLFLPYQPPQTTGLARRLNPYVHYLACRWDYSKTPKQTLLQHQALIHAPKTNITLTAFPADWGPNQNTGRVADLSPSLLQDLQIQTDEEVTVTFPKP